MQQEWGSTTVPNPPPEDTQAELKIKGIKETLRHLWPYSPPSAGNHHQGPARGWTETAEAFYTALGLGGGAKGGVLPDYLGCIHNSSLWFTTCANIGSAFSKIHPQHSLVCDSSAFRVTPTNDPKVGKVLSTLSNSKAKDIHGLDTASLKRS